MKKTRLSPSALFLLALVVPREARSAALGDALERFNADAERFGPRKARLLFYRDLAVEVGLCVVRVMTSPATAVVKAALSFFAAVASINSEWADAKRDEIRDVLSELSSLHEHYRKQLETCRTALDSKSNVLKLTAAISRIPGRDDPRQIVRDTASSAEEFCQQVIVAVIRARELMVPSLDQASKKLDRAGGFIRAANEKNAQIQEFRETGNIASDEFLMLTNALSADLRLAKEELESEGWIDREALKRAGNITAAIKQAAKDLHVIVGPR